MFVMVQMINSGGISIQGTFGLFKSLEDPKLKKLLVEKGFVQPDEKVKPTVWYSNKQQSISVAVCEVQPTTNML